MAGGDGPTLSVVIACRNEAVWLPVQLAALAAQARDGWVDTILVDDGSTDGTARVAEEHGAGLPGFRILHTGGGNRARALNAGVAASTGDAVVFLDGDDEVAPGYLAALRAALADHPFVAARIDHDALNAEWLHGTRPPEQSQGLCHEPQLDWPVAGGGTLAVHRDVFASIGGNDEAMAYAQDSDLCWQLALRGVPLTFVPDAVLRYRYRGTTRGTFAQARRYGRGGVALDHRWGVRPSRSRTAVRMGRRTLRLLSLAPRLLRFRNPTVRVTTAFRAGHIVGWLEATAWPRRFYSAETLRRVAPQ